MYCMLTYCWLGRCDWRAWSWICPLFALPCKGSQRDISSNRRPYPRFPWQFCLDDTSKRIWPRSTRIMLIKSLSKCALTLCSTLFYVPANVSNGWHALLCKGSKQPLHGNFLSLTQMLIACRLLIILFPSWLLRSRKWTWLTCQVTFRPIRRCLQPETSCHTSNIPSYTKKIVNLRINLWLLLREDGILRREHEGDQVHLLVVEAVLFCVEVRVLHVAVFSL